ncbi:MAG: tetratricopeptide repeat protein [Pseudonocardiaceae bacterium]
MEDAAVEPAPEAVTHLWACVRKALAANEDPSPRRIDRMAAAAGLELAGSTVAGWFETWSVVPAWEKFDVLVKALAAEQDEDWHALHRAALTADRERKRDERRRKEGSRATAPVDPRDPPIDPRATREGADPAGQSPAERSPGSAPRQLPVDVTHFIGRDAELASLDAFLPQDEVDRPSVMVIQAIAGTAGVGKTALVVHWAHRVRDHFPDGQLFINLRGYDPGPPLAPEQALEELLRGLEVPAERIPAGLGARAALYRSLLDRRRVLIVLDNANAAEQVRPLLPGSAACRVVVTSRSRLSGLIARDGASRVTVDLLPPDQAITLLRGVMGPARVAAEPDATAELANRCAYLPLALRIAAERAVTHPHVTLAELAGELAVAHDRLDLLATADEEDEATAVRAVFSWSYHALAPEAARAFRLLGLHAGPDISAPATAALTNTTPAQARQLLETLASTHLIEAIGRDQYRFHDLLRVYAAECAREENDQDRAAAVRRVLTWYLHTGDAADRMLNPHRRRIPLERPEAACAPLEFTDYGQALDWCEAQRTNLVAAVRQAAEADEHAIACRLPYALWGFFNLRKHLADLIATHAIGLTAATHLHDRKIESWILGGIGMAYLHLRRHQEAFDHFQRALPICREIGDQWAEAIALTGLAAACFYLGRYPEAFEYAQREQAIRQEIDDPWSETFSLVNLGAAHRKLQRFEAALDYFQRALTLVRAAHYPWGEATVLHNLGSTYRDLARFEDALENFQRARVTYREISDRWGEARALLNIGDILKELNHAEEAATYWRQALPIFEDFNDTLKTAQVRASLEILDAANPDQRR